MADKKPFGLISGELFIRSGDGVEIPLGEVEIPIHLEVKVSS